jgi:hypothetical protein
MSSRSLQCLVTGNKYTFGKEYFAKKVEEFESEENLKRFFITKKAKTYLNKGYSVQEIRKILGVEDGGIPHADSQDIKDLIDFHKLRNVGSRKKVSNTYNFATHKSDSAVAEFINNIKDFEVS